MRPLLGGPNAPEEIGKVAVQPEGVAGVAWLPGLARSELAATVCEHLDWHIAAGTAKVQACQRLLERLEAAGRVECPRCGSERCAPANGGVCA